MRQLVLAIEPDHRQAAIVKRIVREKVLADVTVVDSRDAALEAIRATMPDVLLLSTLLSPRDEAELIALLRTLQNAEHLQTHTIPQLSSSFEDDDQPSRGLLSAFWRRKASGLRPSGGLAGCDPDLFADEIRTYLKRAADKKREVRDAAAAGTFVPSPSIPAPAAEPKRTHSNDVSDPAAGSSWASPFEWRPSTVSRKATVVQPESAATHFDPLIVSKPGPAVAPEPTLAPESIFATESGVESHSILLPEPEPIPVYPELIPETTLAFTDMSDVSPALAVDEAPVVEQPVVSPPRGPLVVRIARGWWYEEGDRTAQPDPVSELRAVLASLAIPLTVAAIRYAEGCRIRRVRVAAA
jgi:hypothetical protein